MGAASAPYSGQPFPQAQKTCEIVSCPISARCWLYSTNWSCWMSASASSRHFQIRNTRNDPWMTLPSKAIVYSPLKEHSQGWDPMRTPSMAFPSGRCSWKMVSYSPMTTSPHMPFSNACRRLRCLLFRRSSSLSGSPRTVTLGALNSWCTSSLCGSWKIS